MWRVTGTQINGSWLNVEPLRMLYEFDGPKIFVCSDVPGVNEYLAFQCGQGQGVMRFLVVPFSEDLEYKLTTGGINLHDTLMRPRAWVFDLDYAWNTVGAWDVQVENLPRNCLPKPGVMLWSHLTPRVKEIGKRSCATETILSPVYLGAPSENPNSHIVMGAA